MKAEPNVERWEGMNKQYVIGLLTPILDGYYFGTIIKSLSSFAKRENIKVVVVGTNINSKDTYALDYVDLWVVVMNTISEQYIEQIKQRNKPIIGINTYFKTDYSILIDNEALIIQAVEHLKDHGRSKIGYVGSKNYRDGMERLKAFEKYSDQSYAYHFFDTFTDNLPVIAKEIAESKDPISGLICGTDFIAAELINELKDYQIMVPEDIAVISFDDIPAAQSNLHSLSTIHIKFDDIGRYIVEAFLHYIEHQSFPDDCVYLDAYSVFRRSCGCDWEDETVGLTNPIETIDHLSDLISRNFILGQRMQFYNTEELLQLNWLNQTPIRKGLLSLKDNGTFKTNVFETFDVISEKPTKQVFYGNIDSQAFPPKELLFNNSFMGENNTMIVIPIVQEDHYFGMFGFVGIDDIMTQLMPLHTTYQLAIYFAAGYLRANITERMNNYSQQLEMVSDIIYDGIWEYTNINKQIVCRGGIVQHFDKRTNYTTIDFNRIVNIIHPKDREFFLATLALDRKMTKQINLEVRLITNNNQLMWVQIIGQFIYVDGTLTKAVGSVKDITNRKKADAKINELAFYDTLTGLANRFSFEKQLAKEIETAKNNEQSIALILCDLDRFKVINDSYGHKVGDHILKTVAARVNPLLTENQFFARFGGDEFVVIMPNIDDNQEAYQLASDIVKVINQPIYDEYRHYQISTSVGISIYPENSKSTDMLVSADIAMYSAKAEGRNRIHIFNDQIKHHNASQIKLEEQLRHAVEHDELSLHFQPIYYVNSQEIYGVEALLRWNSKEFGNVSPRDFIPLAEETGLIVSIGEWVIYEAIRVMKKWQKQYDVPIKMFINLSSRQVNHPNFSKELKRIFDITDIDPHRISFEITESMMIDNFEQGKLILGELIDMGVKLSLDDFGTGYSSLSSLRHLPFQILKIDKSFIDDLSAVDANVAILKAIIEMAHSLNLSVVAEGIERQEQYDLVASLGVDFIQGYYTSPPLPEDKVEKIFQDKIPTKTE